VKAKGNGATGKRDLRTGTPLWLRRGDVRVPFGPLERSISTDVAVIGAGVSGALIADALLTSGLDVVVLDRRGPVRGSTPASTALLQFELDQPLIHLTRKIGLERAARAYWRSASAVDALRGRIADLGLRCGFRERSTVYLPGNVLRGAELTREAEARARIGLRSRRIDSRELRELTRIERPGAILSSGAGELDPVAFVSGLLRSVVARGATIHAPTEVVDVDHGRARVVLTTDEGHEVRARHVVFATGYELSKLVKPRGYDVISTWAMATKPQPKKLWPSRCLIWEAADPYLYVRTTPDGRVIAGGEDEEFEDDDARDALTARKIAVIERKLGRLIPGLETKADFRWSGCFGQSATGLPAIGPIPGSPRCFAVLGYGGNGVTFSTIAAQVIQRAVLGIEDPDADLFALSR